MMVVIPSSLVNELISWSMTMDVSGSSPELGSSQNRYSGSNAGPVGEMPANEKPVSEIPVKVRAPKPAAGEGDKAARKAKVQQAIKLSKSKSGKSAKSSKTAKPSKTATKKKQ